MVSLFGPIGTYLQSVPHLTTVWVTSHRDTSRSLGLRSAFSGRDHNRGGM
jgi:hypothetical protein